MADDGIITRATMRIIMAIMVLDGLMMKMLRMKPVLEVFYRPLYLFAFVPDLELFGKC